MTTEPPTPTGNPWAFAAVLGGAALATVWAVRRAGGLAVALTTTAGEREPSAVHTVLYGAAGDELGDEPGTEYAAGDEDEDEDEDEPAPRGSAVDSW